MREENFLQQISGSFRDYVAEGTYYNWGLLVVMIVLAVLLAIHLVKLHREEQAREARRFEKMDEKAARVRPPVKMPRPNIVLGTRQARERFRKKF
ncbi:MAG: hypothetical protein HQL63_07085 [Magnetococcales bacterium]|nr:hypothetical protein [Magnetococcales bacterium]MBF0322926.1 hypothetical protein [Magnetococcales bacterium]